MTFAQGAAPASATSNLWVFGTLPSRARGDSAHPRIGVRTRALPDASRPDSVQWLTMTSLVGGLCSRAGVGVSGYGSLIFKPPTGADPQYRVPGYIEGYRRVWWQSSTDHRGTPEAPGTVVTLVKDNRPGARVWGVAARISEGVGPAECERIMADLDYREKQYDHREALDVRGADGHIVAPRALTYLGTPAGANWAGERTLAEIARNIATARGPSGPNDEYLFRLAEAFRATPERAEPELFELEALVRRLQREPAGGPAPAPVALAQEPASPTPSAPGSAPAAR